jgi:hypothetical protein
MAEGLIYFFQHSITPWPRLSRIFGNFLIAFVEVIVPENYIKTLVA